MKYVMEETANGFSLKRTHIFSLRPFGVSLSEINIALETLRLEDEFSFWEDLLLFWVSAMLVFRGVFVESNQHYCIISPLRMKKIAALRHILIQPATAVSSIIIGSSIINHPFWGVSPIFGNTHLVGYTGSLNLNAVI